MMNKKKETGCRSREAGKGEGKMKVGDWRMREPDPHKVEFAFWGDPDVRIKRFRTEGDAREWIDRNRDDLVHVELL